MALKDFATSLVATAPSPATSGTSLVVTTGEGARFPATPFPAVVHSDGVLPTIDTAEKVTVTNISTDTFTITRAQGDTSAQSIAVGWRISAAIFSEQVTEPPTSSTDNAIARFDGTTGKLIQNSAVTVDDTGNMDLGSAALTSGTITVGALTTQTTPGSGVTALEVNTNTINERTATVGVTVDGVLIKDSGVSAGADISTSAGSLVSGTNGGAGGSIELKGAVSGTATIQTGVNAGTPTLTLPTSTDTLVGRATTDTLTNKTISASSNTITNINNSNWSGTDLSVANGGTGASTLASGNFLQGNGTSAVTATKAVPTGDVVGTSDSQTLTNKTISGSSNTISNISPSQRTGGFHIGIISGATLGTTGNKAITGVGFTPKLVRFTVLVSASETSTAGFGIGAMTDSSQFAVATSSLTSSWDRNSSTTACIMWLATTSTPSLLCSYVSMDADGFTINVSSSASNFDVAFEAYA